ncbi:uncharacterized protein LOC120193430 [Hibiscus syriacus]|uniref:uncharacterized protein LOC120193430 n=1 Tax=Hibiscus syriacus TaxID=106335 RepID=UPI00192404A8|nr:uncharacterized protein LOC120193430 [Hibiscus syriacus]
MEDLCMDKSNENLDSNKDTWKPAPKLSYAAITANGPNKDSNPSAALKEQEITFKEGDVTIDRSRDFPKISFSNRVHDLMDQNMKQTIIVRLLGKKIVKLERIEDHTKALTEGPWTIYGNYLTVQPWNREFCSPSLSLSHFLGLGLTSKFCFTYSRRMMLHCLQPGKLQSKKIIFEDVFSARDSATLEHLKELSSRRTVIEESINQSSFITEAVAREMSGGLTSHCLRDLQKLEQYLPLLENLIFHVDLVCNNHYVVRWISELKIRWSSAIISSSFFNLRGPKFFQIDNLRYELGTTLYLYAALLRERAIEILPTDLVQSATLFREAAGVFQHLAVEIFPSLQSAQSVERPPEATPSICTVMSLICLAEAQAVTIRKAEEKGTTVGLLAKLQCGIIELLGEATAILYSNTGECKDISSSFLEFIHLAKLYMS